MLGKMQDWPLLISKLVDHAAVNHGATEIVTYTVEGPVHRYTWAELQARSKKVAQALERRGVQMGDRIATLAWNTYRHVELWFGVAGMGAVSHTINPRLFAQQITYIINHAQDRVLFTDTSFIPILEGIADEITGLEAIVIMTDAANMPETSLPNVLCYEDLLAQEDGNYDWPSFDENQPAGLCYTSGTTGNPKGVLYSNRSTVLHTLAACMVDTVAVSAQDSVLPIVPMFHANAWGIPYAAAAAGARMVLNGPHHDGPKVHEIITNEGVTNTAAVPTIWLAVLDYLRKSGKDMGKLKRVTIGGSAAPRFMIEAFQDKYGVTVSHAWGMTELSPLGTVGSLTGRTATLSDEEKLDLQCKQGRPVFGVEMKIDDGDGGFQPRDGKTFGHIKVRGPWVVDTYFEGEGGTIVDQDGWFDTGDVGTLDEHGFMQITDRSKDVIKSGGEWISSIDLENEAVGHPLVKEAAVIGLPHPKWDERPLLILVKEDGEELAKEDVLNFLSNRIAKWQLPDDVVFVPEIPHTATGKIQKTALRDQFADYKLPTY